MTPEAILNHPPSTLSNEQRLHYFDRGYLKLDAYVQGEELAGLQAAVRELVSRSGSLSESNPHYELADEHSAENPHPVVFKMVADLHPDIWTYVSGAHLTDVAVDLLGPDVKFRESYINFKEGRGWQKRELAPRLPVFPNHQSRHDHGAHLLRGSHRRDGTHPSPRRQSPWSALRSL